MYQELDGEALVAFREHLTRTGARETCQACDVDNWTAHWYINQRAFILKTCLHCAVITFFDAERMGILPPYPTEAITSATSATASLLPLTVRFVVDGTERFVTLVTE